MFYHFTTFLSFRLVCNFEIFCIHEDSEKLFEETLKEMKNQILLSNYSWKEFYEFKEQFIDFKYNYALSVHKSQGSTFDKVIINLKDIDFCKEPKEKERMLYTAITRASELVILYN